MAFMRVKPKRARNTGSTNEAVSDMIDLMVISAEMMTDPNYSTISSGGFMVLLLRMRPILTINENEKERSPKIQLFHFRALSSKDASYNESAKVMGNLAGACFILAGDNIYFGGMRHYLPTSSSQLHRTRKVILLLPSTSIIHHLIIIIIIPSASSSC